MVGELPVLQPAPPVIAGSPHPVRGLVPGGRGADLLSPAERHEGGVPLPQPLARVRPPPFQPQPEAGDQAERPRALVAGCDGRIVPAPLVFPPGLRPAVIEDRFAAHGQFDRAVHAADGAEKALLGLVIAGRAPVPLPATGAVPGADQQGISHDDPPGGGPPGRLKNHGAGQVPATGRHDHAVGTESEPSRRPVQHRPEHARGIRPGKAQPFDVPARSDQRVDLAVREEGVFVYRGEGAAEKPRMVSAGGAGRPPRGRHRLLTPRLFGRRNGRSLGIRRSHRKAAPILS